MTLAGRLSCSGVVAVLVTIIVALLFKFVVAGKTVAGTDGRDVIVLEPSERHLVLGEMRQFLSGIQIITTALTHNDLQTVAATARALGTAAAAGVPGTLMAKLPLGFKHLGLSVHRDFDQIALDAESLGDAQHTLSQLGTLMNQCVACHSAFQIRVPPRPN